MADRLTFGVDMSPADLGRFLAQTYVFRAPASGKECQEVSDLIVRKTALSSQVWCILSSVARNLETRALPVSDRMFASG